MVQRVERTTRSWNVLLGAGTLTCAALGLFHFAPEVDNDVVGGGRGNPTVAVAFFRWLIENESRPAPPSKQQAFELEKSRQLVGLSKAEVRARFGPPIAEGPFEWVYVVQKCFWIDDVGFWIHFDGTGSVTEAHVGDVEQESFDHYESLRRSLASQVKPAGE